MAQISPFGQGSPGGYDLLYTHSCGIFRRHVGDPGVFARPFLALRDSRLLDSLPHFEASVSVVSRANLNIMMPPRTLSGHPADFMPAVASINSFRYIEPLEGREEARVARLGAPLGHGLRRFFGDFPPRLPVLNGFCTGQGHSTPSVPSARDTNFELAVRSRLCPVALGDLSVTWIPRGDPRWFAPVQAFSYEGSWALAIGQSTILGRGSGLFVFENDLPHQWLEWVVDQMVVIGWFSVRSLSLAELPLIPDSQIVELVFDDGPRYFYLNKVLASIQCAWVSDSTFKNTCCWVVDGDFIGIKSVAPLINCQECFLPFGWTYGPTRNQSPFVCYQIWRSEKETILRSTSAFHRRLAWILTKDFGDPSPRYLLRRAWGLRDDPPSEALISVLTYGVWVDSLSIIESGTNRSMMPAYIATPSSLPTVLGAPIGAVVPALTLVVPRAKIKARKRRRIEAAVLRSSGTVLAVLPPSISLELVSDGQFSVETAHSLPKGLVVKRQKSFRRRWNKWKKYYMAAQQQMWLALQVLAAEPSELHFAAQLQDIAVELSSTTDCSDASEYIAQQRAGGALLQFDFARLKEDEAEVVSQGLDSFIESRFIKYPGLGFDDLYQFVTDRGLCADKRDRLFDLLEFGQSSFMLDSFVPNGCSKSVRNGLGYDSHRALCEHTVAKLYSESRCILVSEELIVSRYMVKGLHVSPCNTVHKEGAVKRVVTDLSHGRDGVSSYNHSVDLEKHLETYPRHPLPTLRHVATLACQMRREHPEAGLLHGGVVDVRIAYQQYRLSLSKAKLVCTRLFTRRCINGFDQDVAVIMIALTGTFGDVGAGDTYAILGDVFHELHNAVWALWRSVTYVDDMLILAPPFVAKPHPLQSQHPFPACEGVFGGSADGAPAMLEGSQYFIHQAVTYARNLIGNVLGSQATEPRKAKWFYGCLIGIGWYFNLIYSEFYVLPKPEKLRKIVHYLFNVIPVGSEIAPYTAVRELQGLLCWFSAALPLGKSFVYSLFRCRPSTAGLVTFSAVCIRDLDFWRSLARCAMIYPHLFGTKLENLEYGRLPRWFIRTDASTGHGGGGWLSKSSSWVPDAAASRCFALRWTAEELAHINQWLLDIPCPVTEEDVDLLKENMHHYCSDSTLPTSLRELEPLLGSNTSDTGTSGFQPPLSVDINVLEFATAVLTMMLWAPIWQGSCVCLGAVTQPRCVGWSSTKPPI